MLNSFSLLRKNWYFWSLKLGKLSEILQIISHDFSQKTKLKKRKGKFYVKFFVLYIIVPSRYHKMQIRRIASIYWCNLLIAVSTTNLFIYLSNSHGRSTAVKRRDYYLFTLADSWPVTGNDVTFAIHYEKLIFTEANWIEHWMISAECRSFQLSRDKLSRDWQMKRRIDDR